jgi:hypothetical protein
VLPVLLLCASCSNDSRVRDNDPLTGGGPAIPARGETPAATASAPKTSVPPLPAPSSATSNAALAGGAFQPLDPTRDLRIGDSKPNATPDNWRGPTTAAGATLNAPQPANDARSSGQMVSQPKATARSEIRPVSSLVQAAGSHGASTDALMALLQARGVTFQRLETSGDNLEWKYSCSVPNPANPNIRRTYEARGRDPRSAMAAVLKQMDQEQR